MDNRIELLRKWVRAEVWLGLASVDTDSEGYAASTHLEEREADAYWARVKAELFCKENDDGKDG